MNITDIKNSSGYNDLISFNENIETLDDLSLFGVYLYDDFYYKDFYITNGTDSVTLKTRLDITETEDGYNVTTGLIETTNKIGDLFLPSLYAMGLNPRDEAYTKKVQSDFLSYANNKQYLNDEQEHLLDEIRKNGLNTLVTTYLDLKLNISYANEEILDLYYSFIYDTYGDASKKYSYSPINRKDGIYYITNSSTDNLPSVFGGETQDGNTSMSGYNADGSYNLVKQIIDSDDEDIEIIKEYPVVRISFRFVAPQTGKCIITGMKIRDNKIDVSNNGENMYGTVTEVTCVTYSISGQNFTKTGSVIRSSVSSTETFKNTYRNEWLDAYGMQRTGYGVEAYSPVVDSIGWNGELKPFNVIGTVPNNEPRKQRYTDWEEPTITIIHEPIIDPNPDPIRKGVIDPKKIINPKPSPKKPEPPIRDELSDDTDDDDHSLINASSVGSVYNLTQPNDIVSDFHEWMWDIVNINKLTQIWKNNPTDAIYSLHNIYVIPVNEVTDSTIVLGNVDTEIGCKKVAKRYKDLSFGTIKIWGKYRDFRDYKSTIKLYLPFCNIVTLNTYEVMDSILYLDAVVDVISGDVLYKIRVNRYNRDTDVWNYDYKTIATYTGNCKVDLPYSSNDSKSMLSGLTSAITSAISGNVNGVVNGVGNIMNTSTGGSLNGNTGAMSFKTPYIIFEYPITNNIVDRGRYFGYECNKTVKIGNVKGYAEFDSVHIDTINCTDEERKYITDKLYNGVII